MMGKPLKDWTLEEARDCCNRKRGNCCNCPLSLYGERKCECRLKQYNPGHWDLEEGKKYTDREREDAVVLLRALGYGGLIRNSFGDLYCVATAGKELVKLNPEMFPSIKNGEEDLLKSIAETLNLEEEP
jgi:hypothetical protein